MRANKTSYERMQRVSAILAKRFSGKSLADIGAEETPANIDAGGPATDRQGAERDPATVNRRHPAP